MSSGGLLRIFCDCVSRKFVIFYALQIIGRKLLQRTTYHLHRQLNIEYKHMQITPSIIPNEYARPYTQFDHAEKIVQPVACRDILWPFVQPALSDHPVICHLTNDSSAPAGHADLDSCVEIECIMLFVVSPFDEYRFESASQGKQSREKYYNYTCRYMVERIDKLV